MMCERCEELEEALLRIMQWADAYPTSIFHEPTHEECNKAHTLLKLHGLSIDIFSASMGRHCMKGVGDIARAALAQSGRKDETDEKGQSFHHREPPW